MEDVVVLRAMAGAGLKAGAVMMWKAAGRRFGVGRQAASGRKNSEWVCLIGGTKAGACFTAGSGYCLSVGSRDATEAAEFRSALGFSNAVSANSSNVSKLLFPPSYVGSISHISHPMAFPSPSRLPRTSMANCSDYGRGIVVSHKEQATT